jgi:hypothetical protein
MKVVSEAPANAGKIILGRIAVFPALTPYFL